MVSLGRAFSKCKQRPLAAAGVWRILATSLTNTTSLQRVSLCHCGMSGIFVLITSTYAIAVVRRGVVGQFCTPKHSARFLCNFHTLAVEQTKTSSHAHLLFYFNPSSSQVQNRDVWTDSSWSDMWRHDFWGQRMSDPESHKSFRPLTTITYRFRPRKSLRIMRPKMRLIFCIALGITQTLRYAAPPRTGGLPRLFV